MRASRALVVLGVLALLTGLVGLRGVTQRNDFSPEEPVAVDLRPEPRAPDEVPGVDDSISRVLSALGMMERRPLGGPGDIPDEVARVLAAFDVPLVLDQAAGPVP